MEDDSTKKGEKNPREKGWVIGDDMHIFHWFVYIVLSSFTHCVKLYKCMCFLCVLHLHLPFLPWDEISLHIVLTLHFFEQYFKNHIHTQH
jgi:hypothetical protein